MLVKIANREDPDQNGSALFHKPILVSENLEYLPFRESATYNLQQTTIKIFALFSKITNKA